MADIKVYTTPTCPWCRKTKEFLKEKGVEYDEIDVSSDRGAAKEMIERSGQMGVPQIVVGEKVIVGFDPDEIESAVSS